MHFCRNIQFSSKVLFRPQCSRECSQWGGKIKPLYWEDKWAGYQVLENEGKILKIVLQNDRKKLRELGRYLENVQKISRKYWKKILPAYNVHQLKERGFSEHLSCVLQDKNMTLKCLYLRELEEMVREADNDNDGLINCQGDNHFREGWRLQNGSIFGKVPNGLWPPPSFSENHIANFFRNSWPKYRL